MRVRMKPGLMELTTMLDSAISIARLRVSWATPPFEAAYAPDPGSEIRRCTEQMLTMLPPPDFRISRAAARALRKQAVRLVSSTFHQSSLVSASNDFGTYVAALF